MTLQINNKQIYRPPNRSYKICLIWYSLSSSNLGINALTYSSISMLEQIAEKLDIYFEYTLIQNNPIKQQIEIISINGIAIEVKIDKIKLPILGFYSVRSWLQIIRWLIYGPDQNYKYLSIFDLILDISEGDSFSDIYGKGRFLRVWATKLLAIKINKPIFLMPQTIGPFNHFLSKILAENILSRIPAIYPRDKLSREYLEELLPSRKFQEYLDVAFQLPYVRSNFSNEKIHIGINVSALLYHGGYSRDNQFNLACDYKSAIHIIINKFCSYPDTVVHLIPHIVHCSDFPIEYDYAVEKEIAKEMPELILAPEFETPIDAKSYISGLDFFIGSRMHACIAAYSSQVPVIPLAYSRKFTGLFEYSLDYPYVVDLITDIEPTVIDKVFKGFKCRSELIHAINDHKEYVKNNIEAFNTELTLLVGKICVYPVTK